MVSSAISNVPNCKTRSKEIDMFCEFLTQFAPRTRLLAIIYDIKLQVMQYTHMQQFLQNVQPSSRNVKGRLAGCTRGILSEKQFFDYMLSTKGTQWNKYRQQLLHCDISCSQGPIAAMHRNKHRFAQKKTTFNLSRIQILHMIAYSQISCDQRSAMIHRRRTRP